MSPSQPSPANFSFKSGTCSTETRRSLWNPTQASASNSRNSPSPLAPLCEPESDSAKPWRTRSKPCSLAAKPIQNHQPVHAKLPNPPDGNYAPPNPAPLAAAGVRGRPKSLCRRQGAEKKIAPIPLLSLPDYMPDIRCYFPSNRAVSVFARLLRAETGVGPDLKLGKLILAWNLLGKQGADNGCQEPDGNADEGRVF